MALNAAEVLNTTKARSSQRACFLLQVKREQLAGYLEVHQRVWPEMQDALSRCGWRRYSLFVRPDDGLVVGYFESDDVNAALTAMESQPVNARWQAEMAQYFVQPSGGIAQHGTRQQARTASSCPPSSTRWAMTPCNPTCSQCCRGAS